MRRRRPCSSTSPACRMCWSIIRTRLRDSGSTPVRSSSQAGRFSSKTDQPSWTRTARTLRRKWRAFRRWWWPIHCRTCASRSSAWWRIRARHRRNSRPSRPRRWQPIPTISWRWLSTRTSTSIRARWPPTKVRPSTCCSTTRSSPCKTMSISRWKARLWPTRSAPPMRDNSATLPCAGWLCAKSGARSCPRRPSSMRTAPSLSRERRSIPSTGSTRYWRAASPARRSTGRRDSTALTIWLRNASNCSTRWFST